MLQKYNNKNQCRQIKDVIGTGGKVINKIIAETNVKIDIEEDGSVCVYSNDSKNAETAMKMIKDIAREIETGEIYDGVVTKISHSEHLLIQVEEKKDYFIFQKYQVKEQKKQKMYQQLETK